MKRTKARMARACALFVEVSDGLFLQWIVSTQGIDAGLEWLRYRNTRHRAVSNLGRRK